MGEDVCDAVRVGGWERGEWEGEKRKLPDDFAGLSSFFSLWISKSFSPNPAEPAADVIDDLLRDRLGHMRL